MAGRPNLRACSHLGRLLLLALALSLQLANAQSRTVAECVSTPGVNLQLLSACEGLRQSLIASPLPPGQSTALATQITLDPTTSTNAFGFPTSDSNSVVASTSATATSGGLGGFGELSSNAGFGGLPSSGRRSTSQVSGGLEGRPSSTSSGGFPFFATPPSSASGVDSSGVGAGSTSGPGATDGSSPSNTAGGSDASATGGNTAAGGNGASSTSGAPGAAGAQNSNAPGLTQSTENSDPHHYRNTVVIPAAVVASVVPVILLAILACCLLARRKRKRKARESALLAGAGDEKFSGGHGASQAAAVGGAAAGAGAMKSAGHGHGQHDPFAEPYGANGSALAAPASGAGGHHGVGAGTAAGLGAGALAGAGAAGLASRHHSRRDPSASAASGRASTSSTTPIGVKPSGISPAYTAYGPSASDPHGSSTPGHHGPDLGTAAGLGAGAGAAGLTAHERSGHEPSSHGHPRISGTQQTPAAMQPTGSGGPYAAHEPSNSGHHGLGVPTAAGLGAGAGAAGLAAHEHSRHEPSSYTQSGGGNPYAVNDGPYSQNTTYPSYDPSTSEGHHHGPGLGTAAGLGAGAGAAGIAAHEYSRHEPSGYTQPGGGNPYADGNQPYGQNTSYPTHDPSTSGHYGPGLGTTAGLGAGAGAAGIAAHDHARRLSTPSNYSSAASTQNAFHGFSGGGTPMTASPVPPSSDTPRGSTLSPTTAAALGVGGLGAGAAAYQHIREREAPSMTSTVRSTDAPTLPPMEPSIGSGSWISPDYEEAASSANIPRDPASYSGSDYGIPREDASDRYSGGIAPNRPSANYSHQSAGSSNRRSDGPSLTGGAMEDPFRTPPRSVRQGNGYGAPALPTRSPQRSPEASQPEFAPTQAPVTPAHPHTSHQPIYTPSQQQYTPSNYTPGSTQPAASQYTPSPAQPLHSQPTATSNNLNRPVSPRDENSKAARVLGLDSGSGRASPAPPSTGNSGTRSSPWRPTAVGDIMPGPFRGPGYTSPRVGPDDDTDDVPMQSSMGPGAPHGGLGESQAQTMPQTQQVPQTQTIPETQQAPASPQSQSSEQYTSYPTEDEVRGFNFGSGDEAGEVGEAQSARRFSVPRKPVARDGGLDWRVG